ncbi:MAG: hypothetical protein DHS20C18_14750 [Saprospiraceae bacterium]|nr:MAG: hypothetical protein DHS20C18_14750 [Saprospiraceae bacterium]
MQVNAQTITVRDGDLLGGQSYVWTSDKTYLLDGFVFLEEGGTLTIEPGTVIKGKETPSSNDLASTLIITRGAKIIANGTASQPIIFTAETDNLDENDPLLFPEDRGLWGGLILLGNATITDETNEVVVEGLPETDQRSLFGGSNDGDDSGILRYVSIRHGGAELAPGNEINGLSLAGIGNGTIIEHVEIFANSDDGIELFGGTVDVKYAVAAFCGDDAFDFDTGWRGRGQFWLALQGADDGDNGAEMDGAKPDANTPSTNPLIYNATYIGAGTGSAAANEHALLFRDGCRGSYFNSIFTDFANFAIQVEDRASGVDSRQYMEGGELVLANNIWFGFGNGDTFETGKMIQATADAEDPTCQFLINHLTANNNSVTNPQLGGISRQGDGNFDPRPATDGPAFNGLANYPNDDFYTEVGFKGAFGGTLWIRDWTALDYYGFLPGQEEITIKDNDLQGGQTYQWTNDNIYLLDGFVYLEEGGKLMIEEGTVIKGKETPSSNDLASTLIITRGAQICAIGTAQNPIIFTAEIDDPNDPTDMFVDDRGLWGGLILLGNANITDETAEVVVEGLPETDARSLYGGNNDADNSGILKYVSIRHGGAELAPGNEINGLTLGAVGSSTDISFVEIIGNSDDGVELFGGTVDLKYMVSAFCGDDAFDFDTGWRGRGQFWLALQGADDGDNGAEMDGAKPDANAPSTNPLIYNATYVGTGTGSAAANEHALLFRDGCRGSYFNSIFTDFANFAIQVEDRASGVDSRQYMEAGELVLANNIWFGFGNGDEFVAGELIQATSDAEDPTCQFLIDHLNANDNTVQDPQLGGISREADGNLDLRPDLAGPAYTDLAANPEDGFFSTVNFKGAFGEGCTWTTGWTALSEYNVQDPTICYGDYETLVDVEDLVIEDNGFRLTQNRPNPANGTTTIVFELPTTSTVTIVITDFNGREVSRLIDNDRLVAGAHTLEVNTTNFPAGMYVYTLISEGTVISKKMVVNN